MGTAREDSIHENRKDGTFFRGASELDDYYRHSGGMEVLRKERAVAQLTGNYIKTQHYYISLPSGYRPGKLRTGLEGMILVSEAAKILEVSPRWIREMIHRGTLNYKKRGRVYVYEKEVEERKKEMTRRKRK